MQTFVGASPLTAQIAADKRLAAPSTAWVSLRRDGEVTGDLGHRLALEHAGGDADAGPGQDEAVVDVHERQRARPAT